MRFLLCYSCYSMFLGFARSAVNFHAEDGSGYEFMGNSILKVHGSCQHPFRLLWSVQVHASQLQDSCADQILSV